MIKQRYRLSVVVEFDAPDDIEAKRFAAKAQEEIARWTPHDCQVTDEAREVKLQRVYDNKPPEKVHLSK